MFSIWLMLIAVMALPFIQAAFNPLQESRQLAYVVGGLAGVLALVLLLLQPILAAGYLPGIRVSHARRWHRRVGVGIVVAVLVHIVGLYVTSPDDVTDVLLLRAPTQFSVYGFIGLWAIVITAILVAIRSHKLLSHTVWNIVHNVLAMVVVVASVVHAILIDGTMEYSSKLLLCVCIVVVSLVAVVHVRLVRVPSRKHRT